MYRRSDNSRFGITEAVLVVYSRFIAHLLWNMAEKML